VPDLNVLLQITNESLTAIIVIVAASLLLYNLSRNLYAPVVRASSVLLACVTLVSTIDVFAFFETTQSSLQVWLRLQWVGIAYAPAAMFHLSDALLATTGLVSRGRRRRVMRRLYYLSTLFVVMALFTDVLVHGFVSDPAGHLLAGPVFALYVTYFLIATVVSVYNVLRARQRCLTTYTHRRMTYLLYSFAMPAFGIFPFSLLFAGTGQANEVMFWVLVNLSSLGLVLTMLFLSFPLAFFGSNIPDRAVKAELLQFFLRGPAAGVIVLLVILYLPQAGRILGLPGEEVMPFMVVAMVMFWQWMVSLGMPHLERFLVYTDDQSQMRMVQSIGQRLLTQNDLAQLFEAILAATCDLLQVPVGFIAAVESDGLRIESVVGAWTPPEGWEEEADLLAYVRQNSAEPVVLWQRFWVAPLYSQRTWDDPVNGNGSAQRLLGLMAVDSMGDPTELADEEREVFQVLVLQAAQTLDDQLLQREVFAALEGLLPEMEAVQQLRDAARYGDFPSLTMAHGHTASIFKSPDYLDNVRDALRDYWGGPRLTKSPLLQLRVVRAELGNYDHNPTRSLRAVLLEAVNRIRPNGERSMTRTEWTLYNILDLRFIQGYKVRDVAKRLAMSEADLYRKQRAAIEEVSRILVDMEQEVTSEDV
jgi:hypothetical protein